MDLSGYTIGIGITGSFCTFDKVKIEIREMKQVFGDIVPIFSNSAASYDTRFGTAEKMREDIEEITGHKIIDTIMGAEPIGPKGYLDAMVIAPCTGNTLAKLANGITDSPVLMAAKAHLRNNKPLIISISTNDAMGINFKNIGLLMNMKNIYFVPFAQDDPVKKPNSLIANLKLIPDTIEMAMQGKQIEPVLV
ncbi:dipicolinate synthase subunit B [Coprococcus sp. OM04-5BH]|jgi:dipicolinate synthase subunit B|uniref:dipicolinate synthase subunit B n=1 Tax=Coprococcus sp. OM04-5BH TaxID=2293093 RepID=UPI000E4854F9|nr:dipicolinate synthase subunit B [Coprococcus sp. OM04-5BH]RHV32432.1 dipicolinate synthase subunit B [Coprococcus sp. OM04-5BH]